MPWKAYSENGRYQVRKVVDGKPGEAVGDPHDKKSEALAHVRALYSNTDENFSSAEEIMKTNLMTGAVHFEADESNPRLLHFKDHILARAETNKNKDRVDENGIRELAETIALMPIDFSHDPKKNVGTFTAGRVGSDGELRVDGVIWLDRCEENGVSAQDVYDGKLGTSKEADATSAECSKCNQVFSNESQYCDHLRVNGNDMGIRAKLKHGAERIMRGLRALGGAFTYRPAGSATGADASSRIIFAASHVEAFSPDELIVEAEMKNEENPMDDKEKETPEVEKKDTPEKVEKGEEVDMKAEYEAMKASVAEMTTKLEAAQQEKAKVESKLQAAQTQLTEAENKIAAQEQTLSENANTLKAHKVSELKSKLVGSVMDEEEFNAKQETLLGLPEEAVELMTRNRKDSKVGGGRLGMAASDHTKETVTLKLY